MSRRTLLYTLYIYTRRPRQSRPGAGRRSLSLGRRENWVVTDRGDRIVSLPPPNTTPHHGSAINGQGIQYNSCSIPRSVSNGNPEINYCRRRRRVAWCVLYRTYSYYTCICSQDPTAEERRRYTLILPVIVFAFQFRSLWRERAPSSDRRESYYRYIRIWYTRCRYLPRRETQTRPFDGLSREGSGKKKNWNK